MTHLWTWLTDSVWVIRWELIAWLFAFGAIGFYLGRRE